MPCLSVGMFIADCFKLTEGSAGRPAPEEPQPDIIPAISLLDKSLRFEFEADPELLQLIKDAATGRATATYKRMDFIWLVLEILIIKIIELQLDGEF